MHNVEESLSQALAERFDPVQAPPLPIGVIRRADRRHLGSLAGAAVITAAIAAIFVAVLVSLAPLSGHKTAPAGQPGSTQGTSGSAAGSGAIVYTRNDAHGWNIYVANGDGSNQHPLTSSVRDYAGAISPDGTSIAFESERRGLTGLAEAASDGTQATLLADDGGYPAWSPDSSGVVFTGHTHVPGREGLGLGLFTIGADGVDRIQVTDGSDNDLTPAWSPDGRRIAFVRFPVDEQGNLSQNGADIFTVAPDGSHVTRLTHHPAYYFGLAWSPDGTQIAFQKDGDVWVMDADGSGAHRLVKQGAYMNGLSWSPDGTQIAYDADGDIWVVGADGSDPHKVIATDDEEMLPSWGPSLPGSR